MIKIYTTTFENYPMATDARNIKCEVDTFYS
uniref:Uncharacterized protein n=1 Tax=Arundo donax TaxID=35708 RepID=A0A0A9CHE3_ARUDO